MPRVDFIENAGPNSVQATLKKLFDGASSVEVQVAFTTRSGLDALLSRLRKVVTKGRVRFLTGLYQSNTEPEALRMLLKAQTQTGGRLEVRLSNETNFHRKAYLIKTMASAQVVLGSSNLTANGLVSGGELNALLSFPLASTKAKEASAVFDRAWRDGVALTSDRIKRYAAKRIRPKTPPMTGPTLLAILGKDAKHKTSDDLPTPTSKRPQYWVHGIAGSVGKTTEAVVADETNWDTNGWAWMSTHSSAYARGDRLLVLDRSSKPAWAFLASVVDTTRTATATADGRDFMAYVHLPNTHRRKLTSKLTRPLRAAGVKATDGSRAKLTTKTWEAIAKLM